MITAPGTPEPPELASGVKVPVGNSTGGVPHSSVQTSSRQRKGRIVGDTAVDHEYSDRRELAKTLRVITMFILAFCACLVVTWFLKDWIQK